MHTKFVKTRSQCWNVKPYMSYQKYEMFLKKVQIAL